MQPEAQFAMPELPDHVFVEHILRKIDDPLDLARIRAVSRPMRDAVGVRGHRLKNYGEMTDDDHEYRPAAYLGYLSTLKHVYRQGHLFNRQYKPTFNAASQGGHLEVLKWLRSIGSQMNEVACSFAAFGGHLEVLKWLRVNGCRISWWARHNAKIDLGFVEDDYVSADDSTLSSESTEFEDSDDDNDETSSDESLG